MPHSLSGRTLLNQYRVDDYIGLTPLGEHYRAVDVYKDRPLGLTILAKSIVGDVEVIRELKDNASKLLAVTHPNLGAYLGLYQTPTLAFILEEWIDGPSLSETLLRAPVDVNEALIYVKTLCAALDALHRQNFLHLNLSPVLIHINKQGNVVLGGIAFAQHVGSRYIKPGIKYPPLYQSPEQIRAENLTPSADIYSLAVLIYQLISGTWINGKPAPKTRDAIRRAHLEIQPPSPAAIRWDIPDHFSRMLLWALRKEPQDRLKSTTELLSALSLAAQIPVDQIPLRADSKNAPVTSAAMTEWKYLPPPKSNVVAADTTPLEDRLSVVTPPPPSAKKAPQLRLMSIIGFLLLAGFISLFWLISPVPTTIEIPIKYTLFASNYTPPPTFTALPRPTEEHGGRIAFTCTRGDFNQLCMVNRDGTDLVQLTDMEAGNYYQTFAPDGGALLFASNRNGSFDLYLLIFDEKNLVQLTDGVGNVISPDYSADGRSIVFANRVGNDPTSIWMMNADGLNPRQIYQGTGPIVAVKWSPDGSKIAYAMSVGVPQEYEIFIMDAQGKNHVRLSQGMEGIGGSLDWSADGKYLLIYAGPYADKDIFRLDLDTVQFTQLTNGGNNAGATYSPDGKYIVFNSMRNDDQADLYIMRADGSNQQQLTNHPEPDWNPQWSP